LFVNSYLTILFQQNNGLLKGFGRFDPTRVIIRNSEMFERIDISSASMILPNVFMHLRNTGNIFNLMTIYFT